MIKEQAEKSEQANETVKISHGESCLKILFHHEFGEREKNEEKPRGVPKMQYW